MPEFPMAVLGSASAIFALVCLFAALLIIRRTQSTYVIAFRLWRLINGKEAISDPTIKGFVDDQSSLMVFRFVSGIRVADLDRAHEIIGEIRRRKIDVSDLRAASRWVSTSNQRLSIKGIPSFWERLVAYLFSVTLCVSAAICLCGVFYDAAVLKFENGGPTFVMDSVAAKIITEDEPLWRSDCAIPVSELASGFTAQQVTEICRKWETNPYFIPRTVSKQRASFGILAALCFYLAQFSLGVLISGVAAIRLRRSFSEVE